MLPATRITNRSPEPLIEDDLGRDPRIGAAENDRERLLAVGEFGAPAAAHECVGDPRVRHEPAVPFAEALERLFRRGH